MAFVFSRNYLERVIGSYEGFLGGVSEFYKDLMRRGAGSWRSFEGVRLGS